MALRFRWRHTSRWVCVLVFTCASVALAVTAKQPSAVQKQVAVGQPAKHQASNASSTTAPASPFSDLSLFFFGSGFAIFVALLGWSDQIRGLTKETYELQGEFMKQYDLSKAELRPVIRAETPDEQLLAFTSLMQTQKLGADGVGLLPLLRAWRKQHLGVARMQSWKYGLTVALSLVFFVSGILLTLGCPEIITILIPGVLLAIIFALIIWTNILENRLHATLNEMMERI
jgi:hypothetical protein